jgi:hypothetical protein
MTKGLPLRKVHTEISRLISHICVEELANYKYRMTLRLKLRWKVDERINDNVYTFIWDDLNENEV